MGRKYVVSFSAVAISAAQDLFEIVPATGKPVVIHALRLSQTSDVGDAQDEVRTIRILRGHTTSGSGGTTPTAAPLDEFDTAAGATLEANNTTQATGGTPAALLTDGWNVRAPYLYLPTPETRPRVGAGTRLVVTIDAPADAITVSGEMTFEEL